MTPHRLLAILALVAPAVSARADEPAPDAIVKAMAQMSFCAAPVFSPDGKTIAFLSDLGGSPQIWTVPATGGWPTKITSLDDPVGGVAWSSDGAWLAIVVSPGGDITPITVNDLGEDTYATPAIADGRLYVRTTTALYAFGKP